MSKHLTKGAALSVEFDWRDVEKALCLVDSNGKNLSNRHSSFCHLSKEAKKSFSHWVRSNLVGDLKVTDSGNIRPCINVVDEPELVDTEGPVPESDHKPSALVARLLSEDIML